ncbi:uncharacterized protein LOC126839727 [Adelges cooleyi]|uniref:uncharacterized protein LOC126839727 n=1 Tax=Adelges cooleyi TaxID=133065 RepID=UPI00218041EC|nr:uncharacterized protein LOC126839727 [Adelges cooleyi]
MRFQLSVFCLTLNFICYLSTGVNRCDNDYEESRPRRHYETLHRKTLLRPTASEITIAISESNVARGIQVEHLQQFFYAGQYPIDFIRLLDTYKTLSYEPIHFSSGEITTLTSNYNDGSKTNRILTQLKFYRKIQEIQCTNSVLLKFSLPNVGSSLDVIVKYVYNMIEMSYRGKFVVSAWLWELHRKLLDMKNSKN